MKIKYVLLLSLIFSHLQISNSNAISTNPSPICVGSSCTITFSFTGDYYSWNAPTSGTFTFQVWGAQGGSALNTNGTEAKSGPLGGYASGDRLITSGETLYIYVGGQGSGSTSTSAAISGGYNGGGIGYNGDVNGRAASGGGGSDIRLGTTSLSNRIIVAGGGAGGGYCTCYGVQTGGHGGGSSGGDGATGGFGASAHNGKGGTQSSGGAGGGNGGSAGSGSAGSGGNGISTLHQYGSSGGGGGYFGGGGAGVGMAAGGGSGFIGSLTNTTNTAGNASMPNPSGGTMTGKSGNGLVKISYVLDTTAPTFTSSSSFSAAENIATSATAATIKVSESATVTISAGADASLFNIYFSDSVTALIKFKSSPNYEAPTDVGANNVYEITLTVTDLAANAGIQSITITVTDEIDTSSFNSFALAGSVTSATFRSAIQINVSVSVASKVTFKAANIIIPGCKSKLANGSGSTFTVSCSWKPSKRGGVTLTAISVPTNSAISGASANPINVSVINRTGPR